MRTLVRLALFAVVALLPPVSASGNHDAACRVLPPSAQQPGQVACNPRQSCIDKAPAGGPARAAAVATCNSLPTSGMCPGMVTVNPQAACLARLPAPPTLSIQTVSVNSGGPAPADRSFLIDAGTDSFFVLHGPNVGLADNRVVSEGLTLQTLQLNFTTGTCNQAGVPQPNCVMIYARPQPLSPGTQQTGRIGLQTAHGQGQSFTVLVQPPAPVARRAPGSSVPVSPGGGAPPAAGGGTPLPGSTATVARETSIRLQLNCPQMLYPNQTGNCQVMAMIDGPGYARDIPGNIVESTPGASYLASISPSSFTIPQQRTGQIQIGLFEVRGGTFGDRNQWPGQPATGTNPCSQTSNPASAYANIRAWAQVPWFNGVMTQEATTAVVVCSSQ